MPIILLITVIIVLIIAYYYFKTKVMSKSPSQPIEYKISSLKAIEDEPIVLAALISMASLSYNEDDNNLANLIESDILKQLTDAANARSSITVAEDIYIKLNDRLVIIDEAARLLNNQISSKDRYHLFILIQKLHEKVEHEDGITFYMKRLEKKLQLND